ncbi:NigD-like C-terminal domain-containing protein [Dysgonomonas sp. 25]|uniref:NigD1/NigD2 family lipoprotein n=1 Tax=Dysgonomonas sp. 25 TaxID=2302933 RepID=UPI0013D1CE99|nr:NigD-like C-terminal domain-containing protein [Dysgonomonas sp. 25]NDV68095.1 hypothetical protein [Dysgonomonas sp. 25]
MKNLRIIALAFALLASGYIFNSCSDDAEFSLDKRAENIATVLETGETGVYAFRIGDSTKLVVAANNIPDITPEYSRVKINYTLLGWLEERNGYYIKLNGMKDILTKEIQTIDQGSPITMDNDPVEVNEISVSDGYLNVTYTFPYGSQSTHEVELYRRRSVLGSPQTDNKVGLEFYHDAGSDTDRWKKTETVCFDLNSLFFQLQTNDVVTLNVKFKTPDGERTYQIKYKP